MIDVTPSAELAGIFNDAVVVATDGAVKASTIDAEGTYWNAIRTACIALAQEVQQQHVAVARDALETTAQGTRFDTLLWARYSQKRKPANRAYVTLTLSRTGTAEGTVDAGFRIGTRGGVVFETAEDVPFGAGVLTSDVLARASIAGPAGNVDAGTITVLQDTAFDSTLTCANTAGAAGGTNAETETQALTSLQLYLDSLSKGTLGALERAALAVPGVGKAVATEADVYADDGTTVVARLTYLAVTDPFGNANAALASAVEAALPEARSAGAPVRVVAAATVWQGVKLSYSYLAGSNNGAVDAAVRAVVLAQINALRPGETYDPGETAALVRKVAGLDYRTVVVTSPSAPQEATTSQIIRTTAARIKVNGR